MNFWLQFSVKFLLNLIRFSRFYAVWHHFCVILSFLLYFNAKTLHHIANCPLWRKLYSTSQLLICWLLYLFLYCVFAKCLIYVCFCLVSTHLIFQTGIFNQSESSIWPKPSLKSKKEAKFCKNSAKILQKLQKFCKITLETPWWRGS